MIVAGSVQLTGREVRLEEAPAPKLSRDYECSNAKLSTTLGFIPRRSVLESVTELLEQARGRRTRRSSPTPTATTSAGSNCSARSSRRSTPSQRSCEGADHGRGRPARPRPHRPAGPRRGLRPSPTPSSTSPTRRRSTRAFAEVEPDVVFNCAAFHNVDVCETEPDSGLGGQRPRGPRPGDAAGRRSSTSRPTTSSTASATSPTPRTTCPSPRSDLRADQARRRVRGAGLRRRGPWSCAPPASTGRTAAPPRAATSCSGCSAARAEQGALKMVADQRLQPTFTVDLAAALVEAVEAGAEGVLHLTAGGACSWFEFTEAIIEPGRHRRSRSRRSRRRSREGGADAAAERRPRPAAGGRPRADAAATTGARRSPTTWRRAGLQRHRNRVRKAE